MDQIIPQNATSQQGGKRCHFFNVLTIRVIPRTFVKKNYEKILNSSEEIEEYIVYPKWT